MPEFSFEAAAEALAEKYLVPSGATRNALATLGSLLDGPLEAFELVVIQRAYRALTDAVRETYRPRSPLEAQAEFERARRAARDEGYADSPEWTAKDTATIQERWARWSPEE